MIYSYINTRENWKNSKLYENTPPCGRRVSTQFLVFPISTRVDITVYQPLSFIYLEKARQSFFSQTIEILDLECVLCHVTGVQNENKNALINPPSWIFPRSVVYKMSWGEFNLPL